MADEDLQDQVEEDSWLYGSNAINPEPPEDGDGDEEDTNNPSAEKENHLLNEDNGNNTSLAEQMEVNPEDEEEEEEGDHEHLGGEMEETDEVPGKKENGSLDSDDSDDDINVVIGDIKSGPSYQIKQRPTLLAPSTTVPAEKPKQPTGKFNIEEFETVGTINGVQAHEFSIDSLEEKPWRKPGADITDYFNYGFNEDTWRSYCERQKKMRMNESGVGLQGLALNVNNAANNSGNSNNRTLTPIANDNSKYTAGLGLMRRAGPPPGRKMTGSIDVIGGNGMMGARREDGTIIKTGFPPNAKENVIQVMTADRREYSRPGGKFDASVPPPPFSGGPSNEPFYDPDPYSYGYEPTQDSQWAPTNTNWTPSGIKELIPLGGPPQMVPPPMGMPPMMGHGGPIVGNLPPPMGGQMPPPHMPMGGPPRNMPMHNDRGDRGERGERGDRDRDREHRERERNDRDRGERDRDRSDRGDRERDREHRGDRDRGETRDRDRERDRSDRDRNRERDRKSEDPERSVRDESPGKNDRDSGRRSVKPERHQEKRRERSRSRERSTRRRSKSRDRDHKSRDKKKSHKKDKEESD